MMTKEMFITLMESLEKIDTVIHGLQDIFDFNMDDGPLVRAWDDLANMISSEMELEVDDDIGPIILHYAFVMNWGEDEASLKVDDTTSIKVNDLDTLYTYLTMKYAADSNKIAERHKRS